MQEQFNELIIRAKGTFRYKWIALSLAWVVCLIGWSVVEFMPNKYMSEAQVHVDSKSMLQPLLKGLAVQQDLLALIHVMQQLMFTQQNLEKIAELAHLTSEKMSDLERYELIQNLKKDIHIKSVKKQTDIFGVDYESSNPETAKNVVLAVLTVFSEQTQQSSIDDAGSSQLFIEKQIKEYESRLRNAEKARENFKRVNFGLLPDENSNQMKKLHDLQDEINNATQLLSESIAERNVLSNQMNELMASKNSWKSITPNSASPEEQKKAALLNKRNELLLKYTEKHPIVLTVDQELQNLAQVEEETKPLNKSNEPSIDKNMMENKYVQDLKMALNTAESKVASYQSKINFFQAQINDLKQELNTRLSVETEMKNLNRDYDSINTNYQALLQRREQASMSQSVDTEATALKFRITEPPNKPLKPSSPNRFILSTAVLLGGLIVGIGVAVLIFMLKPTFMSVRQLREVLNYPVLGSVSYKAILVDKTKMARDHFLFGLFSTGLIAVYLCIMAFNFMEVKNISFANLLH